MIKVNGHKLNVTIFPDRTSQVWKQSKELLDSLNPNILVFEWLFENEGEFFQICQFVDFMKCKAVVPKNMWLVIPYMPYARQDKEMDNSACYALSTFKSVFLDSFDKVTTFDVHNPDFFKGNDKFVNILPTEKVLDIVAEHHIDALVFPDKGAEARYGKLVNLETYTADKVRVQETGEITGMKMDKLPPEASTVLVQDDLCDGGRTFVEVAKLLLPCKPTKLILYVSHGIFSKGMDILYEAGYTHIYTKDGLCQK